MAEKTESEPKIGTPLGAHLAAIRADRGYSLRRVEELTNSKVSNPYLNQIETGKISQPSPNILFSLAEVYQTSYETLMELAGYINASHTANAQHGKLPTLSQLNLSEGEERELARYLRYIREKEGKDSEGG